MKYSITYDGKSVTRRADTAEAAIENLCGQYGWRCRLNQLDADTRGIEWAECYADTDGGINYSLRIVAARAEEPENAPPKSVRFWKVETYWGTRYFESEQEAYRIYNANERASISTFTRRSPIRIAAVREKIARDLAEDRRIAAEFENLDVRCEEYRRELREQ